MVNTWWVNQGQSARLGHEYDVVWAPLLAEDKSRVASWDRMEAATKGDMLLHYANGALRGFSSILTPARPAIRPYETGTWNNEGRALDVDFAPLDLPVWLADIPAELRKSEPKPHAAFDVDGSVNQGYFYPVTMELARAALDSAGVKIEVQATSVGDSIFVNGSTDRVGIAKVRAEQPKLRARLVGNRTVAPCDLCGTHYPVEYLVTAHIKKRASCTERERTDPSVVMLACLFGCDAAYERGHLRVDRRGKISLHAPVGPATDKLVQLAGTQARIFSSANQRYFRAHRETHLSA